MFMGVAFILGGKESKDTYDKTLIRGEDCIVEFYVPYPMDESLLLEVCSV